MLYYPEPNPVVVEVSDRLPGKIKQKVFWEKAMSIEPQADGSMQVLMPVTVRLYEVTEAGEYGAELNRNGFTAWGYLLRTDNLTAVDELGQLRYMRETDTTARDLLTGQEVTLPDADGDKYLAWLAALPETLLLQNFFFKLLFDSQDVRLRTLVEQNIKQADRMGRFSPHA
jgi:hypothetical protein